MSEVDDSECGLNELLFLLVATVNFSLPSFFPKTYTLPPVTSFTLAPVTSSTLSLQLLPEELHGYSPSYFPKNYTVTLHEYYELMKEYADDSDDDVSDDSGIEKAPKETLPAPSLPAEDFMEFLKQGRQEFLEEAQPEDDEDEGGKRLVMSRGE